MAIHVCWFLSILLAGMLIPSGALDRSAQNAAARSDQAFEYSDTRDLVALVTDAADLVCVKGEAAFADFRVSGSRWRQGQTYVFVLDPSGNMLVHADPAMEGKNHWDLKDVNGKPIIQGLVGAATAVPTKPAGWYHYQWPAPGDFLPRWKSSYVQLVSAPSGKSYVVGSGMYNDRMERSFVVDMVKAAQGHIEKDGRAAFDLFRDPTGPFLAKDAYVFVYDMYGVNLVLPPFSNLEGRNLIDLKDTQGKLLIQEMLKVVRVTNSGWVDYMWPKPGESVSTQKSAYVTRAKLGAEWVLVGAGVYLADAPKAAPAGKTMSAADVITLVRDGAALLEGRGELAYSQFRVPGSKWLHDDTYLFVWTMDGTRVFHGANPGTEGLDVREIRDVIGRPFGKMIVETAASPSGEGWIHYMYAEPGGIFPTWKSTFVKRVTFPSGQQYAVGCGIYNMQMDRAFIEDVVNRAAALIAARGREAFAQLRDKTGPFLFMDTYVFVDTPEGIEVVNSGQPSLEGTNVLGLKDLKGKAVADEYIAAAMKNGSAWVEYEWYKPGHNTPAHKQAYVRRVQFGQEMYIVGSGFYVD